MNSVSSDLVSSNLVQPFHLAERQCLHVLISNFTLNRNENGITLNVEFGKDTPAIWTNQAKFEIKKRVPDFEAKSRKYQAELDAFLINNEGSSYTFNDSDFPFRYASGGTLPIVRMDDKDYFCLCYRPMFPIGWNINNGSCDSRDELLNPADATERELREELIVVDLKKQRRYVFGGDADKNLDAPEFAVARRLWKERFPAVDFPNFEELIIPLKWLEGTDSVEVCMDDKPSTRTEGIFVNINAMDFGIEIDRVAKISLDSDAMLCNGEIKVDRILDAPIGLFPVDQFGPDAIDDLSEFIPEKVYYCARQYDGSELENIIDKFISHIDSARGVEERGQWDKADKLFDLCPVTRRIMKRFYARQRQEQQSEKGQYNAFISFGGDDVEVAKKVYNFLTKKNKKVFFSEEMFESAFGVAIDEALDNTNCLIAVATNPQNLRRPWPEYEYRSFHVDILNGKKQGASLVSFIGGFKGDALPRPLCTYQAVQFEHNDIESSLESLMKYIHW